jgi:uncharacterized protein YbjT (DUF2867 family)
MDSGSAGGSDHRVTPVSADDVARVLTRALAERSRGRIRLTAGQRVSILGRRLRPA